MDRLEERLAKIEERVDWIVKTLNEIKEEKTASKKMWISIFSSLLASITAIIISILR